MLFVPHSNAGRVLFLSTGLYLAIVSCVYAIFGCFEIWASLMSEMWPKANYVGILLLGLIKVIGAILIAVLFFLRIPALTNAAGWSSMVYTIIALIWLIVSWIMWSHQKKNGWDPKAWEPTFWTFETIFTVVSLGLLYWTMTAWFSASRIQKVGGRGFEGRSWRNVVEYMKQRNKKEAQRLIKADKWLAAETALHTKQEAIAAEKRAQHKQRKLENREEKKKDAEARKLVEPRKVVEPAEPHMGEEV